MRRARVMRPDWIQDGDQLIGIYMGADFTSEHEWGIKGIQKQLGLKQDAYGIERRKILSHEKLNLLTLGPKKGSYLYLESGILHDDFSKSSAFRETAFTGEETLATAWDERSFCIHVREKENVKKLMELEKAIRSNDAAIWIGKLSNNPFENAGLILCIVSRIDPKHLAKMEEADRDRERLILAAKATGIEERLRKAGKDWFALSPAWADDSKTSVRFWLNPYRQDLYESNWYSILGPLECA